MMRKRVPADGTDPTRGETHHPHGKKALVLTQKDGSTLTVADTTAPLPLQIVTKNAAKKGQLDFTDYGAAQKITAPRGAMTADQALKGQKTTT